MQTKVKEWAAFWLLGLIWGSSFLWIKIVVQEIGPLMLVALRLFIGLVGLLIVLRMRRVPLRVEPRLVPHFLLLAVLNTALPFALISWGETRVDSAMASILNGTVPLFTLVIAHFWLEDEHITSGRMIGLLVGFAGVVVLVSRDLNPERLLGGSVWGQAAVLVAAMSYATAITFTRRYLRGQRPLLQATLVVLIADALLWLSLPFLESPLVFPRLAISWFGLLWLGVLGACVAYLLYFYLIEAWGSTRASVVTYVFPVIGLALGITFLGEALDWRLALGSALILTGIVSVNVKGLPGVRKLLHAVAGQSSTRPS